MHESLPIVFVLVVDPIGSGFVQNGTPASRSPASRLLNSLPAANGWCRRRRQHRRSPASRFCSIPTLHAQSVLNLPQILVARADEVIEITRGTTLF
jgi:hypothetical protein